MRLSFTAIFPIQILDGPRETGLQGGDSATVENSTLPETNAKELSVVENRFHDDETSLHLMFAIDYGPDTPSYTPHDSFIPNNVAGLEGHTGSETQVALLENTGLVPYGAVVFNSTSSAERSQEILIEELSHGLGIGTQDDEALRFGECYSGRYCYPRELNLEDSTPETIPGARGSTWSIMAIDPDGFGNSTYRYSLEELLTADFNDIPSKND